MLYKELRDEYIQDKFNTKNSADLKSKKKLNSALKSSCSDPILTLTSF